MGKRRRRKESGRGWEEDSEGGGRGVEKDEKGEGEGKGK